MFSGLDSNINIQMNYWFAEMTGMGSVVPPLFDYIEVNNSLHTHRHFADSTQKTWAPRGAYTAQVLYNISQGWVTHDEVRIFTSCIA